MIRYIRPVPENAARGVVREIYEQIRSELGILGEPLTLHSPLPELLAGLWCSFRESVVAGRASRAMKEVVAVCVARLNECPYCADAHTVFLRATRSHEAAGLLRRGNEARISDQQLRSAAEWAMATLTPAARILKAQPFSLLEAPEFIGTAVWMHYINRMSTVFLRRNLIPLTANPFGFRSLVERMGGRYFAGAIRHAWKPGASLRLLPDLAIPEDLSWASPSPAIARAFAALAAAAEEAGTRAVPPDARECVLERIAAWKGADPGLSRSWIDAAVGRLEGDSRSSAQLALLAALSPHRLGRSEVVDFRARFPEDGSILATTAWGSFAAARRIGSWLKSSCQWSVGSYGS